MPKAVTAVSVADFFAKYGEKLKAELIAGSEGVHRQIREPSINRPALALTGFYKYFAYKRVQVIGSTEMTYFKTLTPIRQAEMMHAMIDRGIPCLVLTRNLLPPKPMLTVARERRLPLYRTPLITMHFVNISTLCIDAEFARQTTEHGTALSIEGVGVMIRGHSGVGKSEAALAIIERGHSLVADDLTHLRVLDERELIASSLPLNRGYMECRGIGIINVAEMFGVRSVRPEVRLDMVVTLQDWRPDVEEERTGLEESFYTILGIRVPHIEIHVRPGRDIARLVEVAALVQALKKMGRDPAKEFNERLIAFMSAQQPPTPESDEEEAAEPEPEEQEQADNPS
ncbi:MAG: HPr(Ser) kinase/phosphatase [Opitutaceae bacterium]|nr:HPr(Ser) kinase/phosphatase [Opitutaceae bacterium]